MRRRLLVMLAVTGAAGVLFAYAAPAHAASPVVVIEGRGWGHGVGMAQDGAYWMGRAGATTERILGQFYAGTALGRGTGTLRVTIGKPALSFALRFPAGGRLERGTTEPLIVPVGGTVAVSAQDPGPIWAVPTDGGTVAVGNHRYRGVIQAVPSGSALQVVDQVDVEQYLLGMGEVLDPRWPAASLRAQAIAARTYALRAMVSSGFVCDDDHCQVYLGQQVEYPAMTKAVEQTRGKVLLYRKKLAATFYSANGGGISATALEGFGGDSYPYLRALPYPTGDPSPWTVRDDVGSIATRLGYPGSLRNLRALEQGPSGRVLRVALEGSAGVVAVDVHRFAAKLGLRSTLFTLRMEHSDVDPTVALPPSADDPGAATPPAPDVVRPELKPVLSSRAIPLPLPPGAGRLPLPFVGAAIGALVLVASELARRCATGATLGR